MTDPVIAQKNPICEDVGPGTYWWCACGRSQTQPYCDGSHTDTEFTPMEVTVPEAKPIAWCGCKHSGTKPFCDGTHSTL